MTRLPSRIRASNFCGRACYAEWQARGRRALEQCIVDILAGNDPMRSSWIQCLLRERYDVEVIEWQLRRALRSLQAKGLIEYGTSRRWRAV